MAIKESFSIIWETQEPIVLEDPLYDILLHLKAVGSISISLNDSQRLIHKFEGLSEQLSNEDITTKILSLVVPHVGDCIQRIMSVGMISYFSLNEHLDNLSDTIRSTLTEILDQHGVFLDSFRVEKIEAPYKDYAKIDLAEKHQMARLSSMQREDSQERVSLRNCICGADMPVDAQFCMECGRKLSE